jgi:integrase
VERLRNDLEVHLVPFFGDYLVDEIGPELIDRYKAEKLDEGRIGASSINKTLTELGQVLRAAVRYGYAERNPVDQVSRCKVRRRAAAFLELDQVEPFIAATPSDYRVLMMVLVGAGLRIGEAFALRWRDVDLLAQPPRLNITRTWDPTSPDPITGARGVEVAVRGRGRIGHDWRASAPRAARSQVRPGRRRGPGIRDASGHPRTPIELPDKGVPTRAR